MAQAGHILPQQRSVLTGTPLRDGRSQRTAISRGRAMRPTAAAAHSNRAAPEPRRCFPLPARLAEATSPPFALSAGFHMRMLECVKYFERRNASSSPTRSAVTAEAVAGFTRATDRPPIVMDTHFNPLATERCAA